MGVPSISSRFFENTNESAFVQYLGALFAAQKPHLASAVTRQQHEQR
jgi:hypothetical protein